MKLPAPLVRGKLIRRYKRFLADIEIESGEVVTAHCANPGSMMGLNAPGLTVWLSVPDNPKRKLKYSWELVSVEGGLVGINTAYPNRLAEEAIAAGRIAALSGYGSLRREVRYGRNSRIDLLLEGNGAPPCYVEVKNVHLHRGGGLAEFPDAVTKRGAKHLAELAGRVAAGERAVMLYIIQRTDCDRFSLARDIDPAYGEAFDAAQAAGVEALCYGCRISHECITVDAPLPLVP